MPGDNSCESILHTLQFEHICPWQASKQGVTVVILPNPPEVAQLDKATVANILHMSSKQQILVNSTPGFLTESAGWRRLPKTSKGKWMLSIFL